MSAIQTPRLRAASVLNGLSRGRTKPCPAPQAIKLVEEGRGA